ncbi:MAG TPA: phosphodiesterase [Deltaproteobacteria bacterium]|nr:phosphodiesterase [Deltaproteobacteria bacterium]
MSASALLVLFVGTLVTVGWIYQRRGSGFALFAGVLLGLHALIAAGLWSVWVDAGLLPVVVVAQATVYVHMVALTMPALRPLWWRALISWLSQWFVASMFLAIPWSIGAAVTGSAPGWWVAFGVGLVGVVQSLRNPRRDIDLVLDGTEVPGLARRAYGEARVERPLRVVQITDPHLGPFMSVERLRGIAQRAVDAHPDLILLTGDYLTMESKGTPGCLAEALAPLKAMEGRVFACHGNHDHESPQMVAHELAICGVRLLVDAAEVVDTPVGPVQIVGADFQWRDRAEHLAGLIAAHPRPEGALRIVLLHDPGAFVHLPEGEADLVLSGHTHGGHVGLLSLGSKWTFIGGVSSVPDHGFWSRGPDRLYVHRATGHYGFPLRVGVPGEEGLMRIHRMQSA